MYNFKSLIKDSTCFKNPEKPTTIDHILTNHPRCFQHSGVYETGLSDFHRLTLTVLKVYHSKQNPKIIQYRDYKNFTNEHFSRDLLRELSFQNVHRAVGAQGAKGGLSPAPSNFLTTNVFYY